MRFGCANESICRIDARVDADPLEPLANISRRTLENFLQ